MGFFTEQGTGIFNAVVGVVVALLLLWGAQSVSEVQKYFWTAVLLVIVVFFVLLIYFDYSIEKIKTYLKEYIKAENNP